MMFIYFLAVVVRMTWLVAGLTILVFRMRGGVTQGIRTIWAELRPFYLPATVIEIGWVAAHQHLRWWEFLLAGAQVWLWWLYKDIDRDDRWKRRRRRLAEKVAEVGGRLTVVPTTEATFDFADRLVDALSYGRRRQ